MQNHVSAVFLGPASTENGISCTICRLRAGCGRCRSRCGTRPASSVLSFRLAWRKEFPGKFRLAANVVLGCHSRACSVVSRQDSAHARMMLMMLQDCPPVLMMLMMRTRTPSMMRARTGVPTCPNYAHDAHQHCQPVRMMLMIARTARMPG